MLHHSEWDCNFLLVTLLTRGGNTYGYLLDGMSQEGFFENYAPFNAVEAGVREIQGMSVTQLSEDSFNNLCRIWNPTRILVGEHNAMDGM